MNIMHIASTVNERIALDQDSISLADHPYKVSQIVYLDILTCFGKCCQEESTATIRA
jgi:hypothetical protein